MKKKIAFFVVIAMLFSLLTGFTVMADSTKVVTIGQDLTDEQEAFIIRYFGVDLNEARVIYVNNQQEREYVGSWIPLEQIGNITISSAYVQPTRSGGIQVKTANLTYVTGNMIASVLSTAGVTNCNVVAAAPFPVSGTGALTGVMIAYQTATGNQIPEEKRDLAIQEFTVTQQISENINENEALQLVNAVKTEIIKNNVDGNDLEAVATVVDDVINNIEQTTIIDNSTTNIDNSVTNVDNSTTTVDNSSTIINKGLTDEEKQMLIDLAADIARQDYNYEDLKETLQRVEENLSNETNLSIVVENNTDIENNPQVIADNDFSVDVDAQNIDETLSDEDTEEDNILEQTEDDMIDFSMQSSTREKDIAIIEENLAEQQNAESMQTDLSNPNNYQMDESTETFFMDESNTVVDNTETPVMDNVVTEEYVADMTTDTYVDDNQAQDMTPVIIEDFTQIEDSTFEDAQTEDIIDETTDEPVIEDVVEDEDTEVPDETEEVTNEVTEEEPIELVVHSQFLALGFDADKFAPTNVLRFFVKENDFVPQNGHLVITDVNGAETCKLDLTDEKLVSVAPMDDTDKESLEWNEGTEMNILIPEDVVSANSTLHLEFDSLETVVDDYVISDISENGISLDIEDMDALKAGSDVKVRWKAAADIDKILFKVDDDTVATLDNTEILTSNDTDSVLCMLTKDGFCKLTAEFYDIDGNLVSTVKLHFNIQEGEISEEPAVMEDENLEEADVDMTWEETLYDETEVFEEAFSEQN